ncbi:MAG: NAD(P)/FAD-dependent oxidoreductase [Gemmatimonadales bacterium]
MRPDRTDVLIVGAGPAGSSTAIRLARQGRKVVMVDRARFPRDKACSEYTSPETLRHLNELGVLGAIDASAANTLAGTTVTGSLGHALTGHFARAGGAPFRPTGLAIPRLLLDATLVDAARRAGVEVVEDATVTDVHRTGRDAMHVTLRPADGTPSHLDARVVVAADGLRSVVARRAGMHRQGWLRRMAFVAHVRRVRGLRQEAELHVGPHGYVGLNPLGSGVTNVALVVPERVASGARGGVEEFFFNQLELVPGIAGRVPRDAVARGVLVTGPFDAMSRRSVADGILLVGDAADFFDPFTGEGICSALAGGAMAANVLDGALARNGPIDASRLASYRALRRQAFLGKWIVERMIGYAMLAPPLFDRAVGRLQQRGMSDMLIGVTGNFVSPWRILNPVALAKMIV